MENFEHFERGMVKILLEELALDVRIGLHAHEKEGDRSQRVLVSVALYADAAAYLAGISPQSLINYDDVYQALKAWAGRDHVLLIETYINEILPLCFVDERILAARVRVSKPDIFPDVADAGVEVFMRRADLA